MFTLNTMKSSVFFIFCFLVLSNMTYGHNPETRNHIVYMGSSDSSTSKENLNVLVSNLLERNTDGVMRIYQYGFHGFAAHLSESEAAQLATHPGVVSVFPDPIFQLQTTHSWDFLEEETSTYYGLTNIVSSSSSKGSDTIIGIIDTGIWPESESFSDRNMDPIPSRWKGECMEGPNFKSSNCNKKLIGARNYEGLPDILSPRDDIGHGTHVAAIAAGNHVHNASYYGLAAGTARGGASASHLAVYRACDFLQCYGSALLAAFDDAIKDGVDVLSLSLGHNRTQGLLENPIAIGSFHAVEKGITVICSAGNDGPFPGTVYNYAPWVITVGAISIDRFFESKVILGNKKVLKGESINFSDLKRSPVYKLVDRSDREASYCQPDSPDEKLKLKGKIVVCKYDQNSTAEQWKSSKVAGIIMIADKLPLNVRWSGLLPITTVTSKDGSTISLYIKSSRNPVATILATTTVLSHRPAPVVSKRSSRGPPYGIANLLKPDVVAPGVQILAAWIGNDSKIALPGRETTRFNLATGTSMACPHVSGLVAVIKSINPTWSPAVIRSAIMTTAIPTDNLNNPIPTEYGTAATPYDSGSGLVSQTRALNPRLAYELGTLDYLKFLCYLGYNTSTIKLIAGDAKGFSCPINGTTNMISNMNYPSIVVSLTSVGYPVTVERTFTNVRIGHKKVYSLSIEAPEGFIVKVVPTELKFTKNTKKLSYKVAFSSTLAVNESVFGQIRWASGKFVVRTPFVITN